MENLVKNNLKDWQGRNVLITGASGLLGSWLIKELLKRGANLVALIRDVNPQSEVYRCEDIQSMNVVNGELENFTDCMRAINDYEVDTVFHLGAQTLVGAAYRFPFQTFETNIRGTYNLLEACRLNQKLIKRILVASSDKAYGEQKNLPYHEAMFLKGHFPYDVSKSCADLIAQSYFYSYQLPIVITRCGNIFGGGDLNWSRIVPGTIRSCLMNEAPVIRSDGQYLRDYLYVKDVVNAYLLLAESIEIIPSIQGQPFNISADQPLKVIEMVQLILKLMSKKKLTPKILNCAHAEIPAQYLSDAKLMKTLGWKSQFTLQQGLIETINWYRDYLKIKK